MNKIIVNNNYIELDNGYFFIECSNDLVVNIKECSDVKIVMINDNMNYSIKFNVNNNSKLVINSLSRDSLINYNFYIGNKASLVFNNSCLSIKNHINNIFIDHDNNSSSYIYNNGLNYGNNKLYFNIDGIIDKNKKNINVSQNSMIINYKDCDSKIIPNLIIDSCDINASHSAYIGEFNKDNIFYMQTRGISDDNITKMLSEAFMFNKMEFDGEYDLFLNKLIEWW